MKLFQSLYIIILVAGFTLSDAYAQTIHEAIRNNEIETVRSLLDNNTSLINAKDENENLPIHIAAEAGNKEIAELLISKGADIEAVGKYKFTALHAALVAKQSDFAGFLIKKGADVNALDAFGRTPLIWVPWFTDDVEIAWLLIEKGADVNFISIEGAEAMELAVFSNRVGLIDLFLEKGAKLPDNEKDIRAYMEASSSSGNVNLFNEMVIRGGDIHMKNKYEGNLIHNAASGGSVKMAELLYGKGLSIEDKDKYGLTPLHIAAARGRKNVVQFLFDKKANINARTINGKSALNFAEESGKTEIAILLKDNGADTGSQKFPVLSGDYVGQKQPGNTAKPFALGIISQNKNEHSMLVFSPDGNEVYWSPAYGQPITYMKRENNRWTKPAAVSFTYGRLDAEPVISHDGKKLFFLSRRPLNENDNSEKERIWFVERKGDGWTNPKPIDPDITAHWQISVAKNGTLYFGGDGKSGRGESDIVMSKLINGKYEKPENLGSIINTDAFEMTPYIDPDEKYIIFKRMGQNSSGLYISFKDKDGNWTDAINMGDKVNTANGEGNPYVSPDGKYFFFSRGGGNDYYWIRSEFIEHLKPEVLKK